MFVIAASRGNMSLVTHNMTLTEASAHCVSLGVTHSATIWLSDFDSQAEYDANVPGFAYSAGLVQPPPSPPSLAAPQVTLGTTGS